MFTEASIVKTAIAAVVIYLAACVFSTDVKPSHAPAARTLASVAVVR